MSTLDLRKPTTQTENKQQNNTTQAPSNAQNFQNIPREDLIFRRIFDDYAVQTKITKHLDHTLFDDKVIQNICKGILMLHKKYNKFPQADELSMAFKDGSEEKLKLVKLMNYNVTKIDREVCIDIIENFFKERKTQRILSDAAAAIYNKDFDNISALTKDLQKAVNFSLHMDLGLNLVEDVDEALKRLNETYKPIPSAIQDIGLWTGRGDSLGGWYHGLSVIMGQPNIGKSIMLCNEAAYAFQNGYNVLYVSLEMSEDQVWERIAVNVSDIPLTKIRDVQKDGIDLKKKLQTNSLNGASECGSMWVRELSSDTTALDIESLIDEIKVSEGIDIDICFIDYLQIMKPANRRGSLGNSNASLYSQGKEVAEQVRDLSRKKKMPIVAPSQLNRDGYDNTQVGLKNTAGSAGINDTADFIVTLMSDEFLKKYAMYLHIIIKNRFGPKDITFLSQCEIQHMRVRSASEEARKKYSETQINQAIEVANFNKEKNVMNQESLVKDSEKIAADKKAKEENRISSIRSNLIELEKKKETIEKKEIDTIHQISKENNIKEPEKPTFNKPVVNLRRN